MAEPVENLAPNPDELIVRCPACRHLVRLPTTYLGQVVTCLECRGPFRAPVRTETGSLSEPVALPKPLRIPARLFVPMYGLMLVGAVGLMLNGYLHFAFVNNPEMAQNYVRNVLAQISQTEPADVAPLKRDGAGRVLPMPADEANAEATKRQVFQTEQDRKMDETIAAAAPTVRDTQWPFALLSVVVFAGGIAIALGRWYPLAFIGCAGAALNINHMCCVPGGIVAIWGVVALISDEGRRHFRRIA